MSHPSQTSPRRMHVESSAVCLCGIESLSYLKIVQDRVTSLHLNRVTAPIASPRLIESLVLTTNSLHHKNPGVPRTPRTDCEPKRLWNVVREREVVPSLLRGLQRVGVLLGTPMSSARDQSRVSSGSSPHKLEPLHE